NEREPELLLQPGGTLLEFGHELAQVGVLTRRREVVPRGRPLLRELVWTFELLQAAADVGRLAVVVVDSRIGHTPLQLLVRALEILHQVVEVRRHRRASVLFAQPASVRIASRFSW